MGVAWSLHGPSPAGTVPRDRFLFAWEMAPAPLLMIPSGSVIEFDMLDSSCGQLGTSSVPEDLVSLDFGRLDQLHGPVAVEGAEPGDTLEIQFLEFLLGEWGWTASIPGFGLLAEDFPDPALRITPIPAGATTCEFLPGIHVPIDPFCGVVGVAPETGPLPTIPPGLHGGNLDTRHLTAGSTLFLPVSQTNALLSAGDGHAAQGDGEVCGTAIESLMRVRMHVTVRKDLHIDAPQFATTRPRPRGPVHATNGIGPDLLRASRDATRRMIDWLVTQRGLTPVDAYLLSSVAVDLGISEIVDVPNFVVTAHCPLSIFR